MSYLLYRNGSTHKIWGKECEYKQFMDEDVEQALDDGWVLHPKDLVDEKCVDVIDAEFEAIDTNDSGKLSNDEVRAAAEKAGIEGFETKRITTLKGELGV